jgi:EAL domain-containing protein (putative c-di-GMP-specific phosphodiesterase class I)/uncharacterized protein involved in exopolysaccharide biosynthesis
MDAPAPATTYRDADSFDIQTSIRTLRQAVFGHVPMIVLTVVVTLSLVLLFVKLFPPIYRAEVLIAGEAQEDQSRTNYYAAWDVFRKGDLKSEPTLMTSRTVAQQVVEQMDLKFDDVHHSVLMHLGYLWTESWLGQRYRALKEWVFPPDPSEYTPTPQEIDRARTIEAYRQSMALVPVGNTTIGRLVVKGPTHRVSEYANKTIDVYLQLRRQVSSDEAETAYQSLKTELDRVSVALVGAEEEKQQFDRRNNLSVEFERDKVLLGKWGELRSTIGELDAQVASAVASLKVIEANLANEPAEIVNGRTFQESRVRTLLQQREFEQSTQLAALQERYRPDSPEVLEAQRLLAESRAQLAREPERSELVQSKMVNPAHQALRSQQQQLTAQLAAARAQLNLRRSDFNSLTARLDALPAVFREAHALSRKRDALEARYRLLNERFMMADVSRTATTRNPSSLRVVDYAAPPMRRSSPNLKLLLPAAVVVGLIFGVGLALLAELFSAKVTRDRLAGRRDMPVYAVVGSSALAALRPAPRLRLPGVRRYVSLPVVPGSALARLRQPGMAGRSAQEHRARMHESAGRRLQLENDLFHAVQRHELVLHYQPRFDLAGGQLAGHEALMRWNHPERGLVPAAEFIRLAEDTGLIVPMGEWALREAARQIRSWADEGRLTRPVSVNLSASQFREHDLVERVRRILVETGVEPSLLEVEISEATLMQQTDQTVARLDALQSLGLRLSIDHVGARHGALAYLSRFPVNRIAIDRAVVARLPGDDASEQIVRSVVAFARGLKLRVAAEGVETAAQLDWLKASGCDEVQGYHLAAPVPAETLLSSAGLDSRSLGGASR